MLKQKPKSVIITGTEEVFTGDSAFQVKCGNHWKNVAHFGHMGFISGKPGTMKSTILRYIAAASSGVTPLDLFRLNLDGRQVVWFDGEQPDDIVVKGVNQIIDISGGQDMTRRLEMHSLCDISNPVDRRRAMWDVIMGRLIDTEQTGAIIIDGIANFIENINDFREAGAFLDKIMFITKKMKCLTFVLSHLTEGDNGRKSYGAAGSRLEQLASFGFHMEVSGKYFTMHDAKGRYGFVAPHSFQFGKAKGELIPEPYYPW